MNLASEKSRELRQNGFTVLRNVVDKDQINKLNQFFSDNIDHFSKGDPFDEFGLKHDVQNGILFDVYQRYPVFRPLAELPIVGEILKSVIGEHIYLYENSLVFAPRFDSTDVPWHQDFQNRPDEPIAYVAFIALDELGKDSGALRVIKESHKAGFLPYRTKSGKGHHTGIPEDKYVTLDLEQLETVDQSPGDIIIFNQLVVHSIPPWKSDSLGRGVRFSYKGFDKMFTPRLSPITIFGGSPSKFSSSYDKSPKHSDLSLKKKLKNKIKTFLMKV